MITGDHTIFYSQDWQQMQNYAASKGINCLDTETNTTMLMLWSPEFKQSVFYEGPTYQMDIYPTILHLIGCESPAWHGVGKDLINDDPRIMTHSTARMLSDKLIRGNYFSKKE